MDIKPVIAVTQTRLLCRFYYPVYTRIVMSISVRYFASLRESMGRADDQIAADMASTVSEVWATVSHGAEMPANTLCSINMEYVDAEHSVKDGDEVAFFPPVTGG